MPALLPGVPPSRFSLPCTTPLRSESPQRPSSCPLGLQGRHGTDLGDKPQRCQEGVWHPGNLCPQQGHLTTSREVGLFISVGRAIWIPRERKMNLSFLEQHRRPTRGGNLGTGAPVSTQPARHPSWERSGLGETNTHTHPKPSLRRDL